jgi:acyl-CoA dehydrogenase
VRFALTDEHRELARTVQQILTERRGPFPPAWDAPPLLDRGLWRALAEVGLLGVTVPEEYGGAGAGLLEAALVAEQAGYTPAPVPYLPAAVVASILVQLQQAGGGCEDVLAGITDGSTVAVPAWETFPSTVVNRRRPAGLQLRDCRVSGLLSTVPFGRDADLLLAVADGALVLVRLDGRGVEREGGRGLDAVEPAAQVRFLDAEARVVGDEPLRGSAIAAIRVLIAAELVGLGQQAVDSTVAYATERQQFGRAIGSFQAIKHTLADRHAQLDAARLLMHWAAATEDRHGARLAVQAADEAATAAATDALQTRGGMGFTWEDSAHVLLKRARSRRALLGSPGRQLDAIADRLFADRRQAAEAA